MSQPRVARSKAKLRPQRSRLNPHCLLYDRPEGVKNERFLKLLLTDGVTSVVAFEYGKVPGLENLAPGAKILLTNPAIRRGNLLLEYTSVKVSCSTLCIQCIRY